MASTLTEANKNKPKCKIFYNLGLSAQLDVLLSLHRIASSLIPYFDVLGIVNLIHHKSAQGHNWFMVKPLVVLIFKELSFLGLRDKAYIQHVL